MDRTEAEDTEKRQQEHTEELYKTDLHDSDNQDSVITPLEPDILECEVKWALGSITTNKASGGEVAQSCPTLCDLVDCNLLGFSVHGILQARILEWIAISFSRGSSRPRDQTQVSCIGGRHFNP